MYFFNFLHPEAPSNCTAGRIQVNAAQSALRFTSLLIKEPSLLQHIWKVSSLDPAGHLRFRHLQNYCPSNLQLNHESLRHEGVPWPDDIVRSHGLKQGWMTICRYMVQVVARRVTLSICGFCDLVAHYRRRPVRFICDQARHRRVGSHAIVGSLCLN